MNTDALEFALLKAERRVLEMQTKLHCWATDDRDRRFDDLFNLVADAAFLLVAWVRVRRNRGARSAGVDGQTARSVEDGQGVEVFLNELRSDLKDRSFRPLPVRERMIPKPGTAKRRRLGIPTVRDRVVQASLKLVLEPIFEADFLPCSYGFRPKRRCGDPQEHLQSSWSHSGGAYEISNADRGCGEPAYGRRGDNSEGHRDHRPGNGPHGPTAG
ncbi:hypothetical protein ACFV2H_49940 [Streptomyces sp. NPDC059629]|uniref:hypothetical protein n=1 Tax=Streptomyces sp. NPDC059629 TaxID=3346889 RepID=UPI003686451C